MLVNEGCVESSSLLSVGSRDVAVWNLTNSQLTFSVDVAHSLHHVVISTGRKDALIVCADAESGVISTVSLTGGCVDHVTKAALEYRGMTDLAVSDGHVFVATLTGGVVMMSLADHDVTGQLSNPDGPS